MTEAILTRLPEWPRGDNKTLLTGDVATATPAIGTRRLTLDVP